MTEDKEKYHQEKEDILEVGLKVSKYIQADDTGARHKGKNGYCTFVGNENFSCFESTYSKSRINFLKILRAGRSDYRINEFAIDYMESNGLPKYMATVIRQFEGVVFWDEDQWNSFIDQNVFSDYHKRIVTEGALIASIIENGVAENLIIVSDDAGQFNLFMHALCWLHAERLIEKIVPPTEQDRKELDRVIDQIWELYDDLKSYKEVPDPAQAKLLDSKFDEIFTQRTSCTDLNEALKRIHKNKNELLLVLEHPDIPLHNNTSERGIREYVKRRKISGSTRGESGRRCRDTFTSLKQTCRKLGLSFWDYLNDRVRNINLIPNLSILVQKAILKPG